ncbi:MAG TPA: L,D-transpeptidase family protein [Sphingomicrobium sp.]|nr:L,D-transpeptidase family protein [Sphingomicrobium sp.]
MNILFKALAITASFALAACQATPTAAPKVAAPAAPVAQPLPYKWTHGNAEKAHKAMLATFSRAGLAPGQFVWADEVPKEGDARVIIDLLTQTAYAYRGDVLVGAASISSAKQGKVTPLGYWKVLEKKKFHRSRKYDNAPMPFMQRLDEYGIALHGGVNPGYPASHGCVRMPMKFAEKLYALTRLGTEVVIEG